MRMVKFFRVSNSILKLPLSEHEKMLLIVLFRYANNNKEIYPNIDTLSDNASMSRPIVIKTLKQLEKKQYIEVKRQHMKPNKYLLHPSLIECSNI